MLAIVFWCKYRERETMSGFSVLETVCNWYVCMCVCAGVINRSFVSV